MESARVKTKRYTYFIGIDVSKDKLDFAVVEAGKLLFHQETANEPEEIIPFVTGLKTLPKFALSKALFCMEHTGIYTNPLIACLKKLKANTVVENALVIKNSTGLIRGKYDKIDAIRIAQFAFKNKDTLRLWVDKRPVIVELKSLFALRNRLLSTQMALRTPLKEQAAFVKKGLAKQSDQLCAKTIQAIAADISVIDQTIDVLLSSDERTKRLMQIITSVPAVGRVTAIQLIISTNEFRDISDPKKFACYAGVAPFVKESGMFKGKGRVSSIANKRIKGILHLCAMTAIRAKGPDQLRAYYDRKTLTEGKPKMAVLNAVRNKLILRIFACVNQDRLFEIQRMQ
ncbi:MAG: IS110 family transposase [Mucilaginibacter sp.]